MPVLNRVAEFQDVVRGWRQALHQNPELNFDVHETSAFVIERLKEFGCDEIVTGIAQTGVVGVIHGRDRNGPTIGLRADMDALPLTEITNLPYASKIDGKMHACGHDGHTAMLLGAAKYLAETRNFKGSVALIFQPAEEGGGGGNEMVKEGMMDRFAIKSVFGMHNMPGIPLGEFAIRPGPIMASTSEFTIIVKGRGGHAAQPHSTIDPIIIGSQIINALQVIASRNIDPIESIVLSVTKFHAGEAYNIIPETAELAGTVRTLRQDLAQEAGLRMKQICDGICAAHGATLEFEYESNYPVTMNWPDETEFAGQVAEQIVGPGRVDHAVAPMLGGEDFSYMLEARPGAYIFLGNGPSAGLHHPAYDFNDEAIPYGISYWVQLAEKALPF